MYKLLKNEEDTSNSFLVSNGVVEVYPVVFSNDGTTLKPPIKFDEDRNVNVGLENHEMTLKQCQSKPFLEKKLLLEKLISEAVVSSVTCLNNDFCLPVAVHYCSKVGESGDNVKETFLDQIRVIQMCENYIVRTKDENMVLAKSNFLLCESYCDNCFTSDAACANCSTKGQTQVNPALRALDYCLKNNFRCIRRVVLVITVACKSGNKQCLKQIQQELNESTINPHLPLLSLLPHVLHVFKTYKVSFSNWYLQLINERGCLSIFYTLRNRADHDVRENVKSFLKSNDYFRNRDHQNPIGVLGICNPEFLTYIVNLGSLILCFMVLYVYLIIFVKQVFYRNLFLT